MTIIDVSRHQSDIDWDRARHEGDVTYAIIRATLGATGRDERYEANWRESGWAGVPRRTVYHYQTRDPGPRQLENIASVVAANPVNAPIVIDCERTTAERQAMAQGWVWPKASYTDGLRIVCFGLRALGWRVRLYSNYWEWLTITTAPAWAAEFEFHGAGYPVIPCDPTYRLRVPPPWTTWGMWQCSSTGHVAGIAGNVDLNVEAAPAPTPVDTTAALVTQHAAAILGLVGEL